MSDNVIGNAIGGVENLGKVLFDFNVKEVIQHFPVGKENELLEKIETELNNDKDFRKTKRSLWPQYCKSLTSGAHFLSQFETKDEFYSWANTMAKDEKTSAILPILISLEVAGLGFPLACDFLKSLGFRNYGKPDVHVIYILEKLGLIEGFYTEKSKNYHILKALQRIAKHVNSDAYSVDKLFWLIGSGNFHLSNINIGRNLEEFITFVKNNVKTH